MANEVDPWDGKNRRESCESHCPFADQAKKSVPRMYIFAMIPFIIGFAGWHISSMDKLREEIAALLDQLNKSDINGSAIERQTISHLNRLVAADETAFDQGLADLKQFWLSSIDWCSELSKQVEKLIIMHEE